MVTNTTHKQTGYDLILHEESKLDKGSLMNYKFLLH